MLKFAIAVLIVSLKHEYPYLLILIRMIGAGAAFFLLGQIAASLSTFVKPEAEMKNYNQCFYALLSLSIGVILFNFNGMGLVLRKIQKNHVHTILPLSMGMLLLLYPFKPNPSPQLDIYTAYLAGLWEELFFRGLLLAIWKFLFGLKSPISRFVYLLLISGWLFAQAHGGFEQDNLAFVARASLGLLLGAVYIQYRNIFLVIAIHTLYDISVQLFVGGGNDACRSIILGLLCIYATWHILKPNFSDEVSQVNRAFKEWSHERIRIRNVQTPS